MDFKINVLHKSVTWFIILDGDCVAVNVGNEPVLACASASVLAFAGMAGIMANAFEENESDREPSKSNSALLAVIGAGVLETVGTADKRKEENMISQ